MASPKLIPVAYDPFRDGEIEAIVSATASQQEIWTSIQMGGDAALAFNESVTVSLDRPLDPSVLALALSDLMATHDALRSCFTPDGRSLLIMAPRPPSLEVIDLKGRSLEDCAAALAAARRTACQRPFDLVAGSLLRCVLLLKDGGSSFVLSAHHVICDGWSLAILVKDLARFYSARLGGGGLARPGSMQFSAYAQRAQKRQASGEEAAAERYWIERFAVLPPPLDLPMKGQRPTLRSFASERIDISIPLGLWAESKQFSARQGSSHLGMMLSLFHLLLRKLSGQSDIVCGIPAAGQSVLGAYDLVGHCVHLLPIRMQIEGEDSFGALLKKMKKALLDAYDHQEYTYGSLLQKLRIERDPARLPIVSVLFNIDQQIEAKELAFGGHLARYESNPRFAENFEIFVNISESRSRVVLECQYNSDLFSPPLVRGFFTSYLTLLEQVLRGAETRLSQLTILSPDDQKALATWNETEAAYPREASLDSLLIARLEKRGQQIVSRSEGSSLSAQDLLDRSRRGAALLRERGVKRGDRVGLCVRRSSDMLVAVLAIWQAGAAYVPLDPDFPLDRLHYMISDAGVAVCWSQSDLRDLLPQAIHVIDGDRPLPAADFRPSNHAGDDVAYVIYTSGSTGRPKGVKIQHRALINFLFGVQKQVRLSSTDCLLAVTTLSFDISILELYLPLLTDASLYIASRDEARDGDRLQRLIVSEAISCLQATPSTWRVLLASGLRPARPLQALCGGEAFPQELARDLLPLCEKVWNMYGPTEATVWASMFRVEDAERPILIGRPLPNYQLYVLSDEGQLLPPGVKGELYIGGEGLALGYHDRPELNAERFLGFPRLGLDRVYRTGDIARFLSDGQLEIFGRSDDQVKVRGYRIELGEIEKALAAHSAIKVVLVIVREDQPGDKRIVAYYEPRCDVAPEELRSFAAKTLPEYMLPQHLIALDRLPLLPNGKLDRKSLPAPHRQLTLVDPGESYAPRDAFETGFLQIWTGSLGTMKARADENFFLAGGHSLLAIQMVARLNRELGTQLQMRDVFVHPLFAALLGKARSTASIPRSGLPLVPRGENVLPELSLLQQRMWYLEQLDPETRVHNLPGAWEIQGPLDRELFAAAFARLIARHEALRSTLETKADTALVVLHEQGDWQPHWMDLSQTPDAMAICQADMNRRALEKLGLDQFPLFHCVLYRLAADRHVLYFMVHHAIWDGWCFDLFLNELGLHYKALSEGGEVELPSLPIQYYDFSSWHKKTVAAAEKPEDLRFWLHALSPVPAPLELPTDFPRPPLQSHAGHTLVFKLSTAELAACEDLARRANVTLFSLFLACYKLLLQRFARQDDIVVGVPLRGRQTSELENVLGLFINVLPLRTQMRAEESFEALARRVHGHCIEAFAHGDMLLETIVAALGLKRDDSRTPLYSAMFSYQDVSDRVQNLAGRPLRQLGVSSHVVHTDQMLWMKKSADSLEGGLDFRSDLWEAASMEDFRDCFVHALRQLPQLAQAPVSELDILPPSLRSRILGGQSAAAPLPHLKQLSQLLDLSAWDASREALVCGELRVSYGELDRRSRQLARFLVESGVKAGDRIGICLHRHQDLVTALLAVLSVGAAYVPMDPNYPAERLAFMLQHAAVRLVLSESDLIDFVPSGTSRIVALDRIDWHRADAALPRLDPAAALSAPAYLIYTSGSTGQPKGVLVSRGALSNFLQGIASVMRLGADDRFLGLTTICFDISILEILGSLSCGATLVLIDQETALDGPRLSRLLDAENVTLMQATPASWRLLLAADWPGRPGMKAVCGGEALPKDLALALRPRCQELWNAYGPTEATVWATLSRIDEPDKPIVIGRPLPGYRAYVLDDQRRLQAPGAWGQLFLGGDSLAAGYHRQDELTAQRFVPNPFVPGERIYDTGDIVRMRWDGQLVFSSRSDNQVKVRGFRIELGEIETHLSAHPAVDKAVVIVREDREGDKRLVAYVVCHPTQKLQLAEMQRHLGLKMPQYMLPNHLVLLSRLPLTDNGKVDKKALPRPVESANIEGERPKNETERLIAAIWSEFLQVSDIRREQMFFDLGGHSLLSIQVVNRINQISQRPLKLRDLLTGTLAQVAAACLIPDAAERLAGGSQGPSASEPSLSARKM